MRLPPFWEVYQKTGKFTAGFMVLPVRYFNLSEKRELTLGTIMLPSTEEIQHIFRN